MDSIPAMMSVAIQAERVLPSSNVARTLAPEAPGRIHTSIESRMLLCRTHCTQRRRTWRHKLAGGARIARTRAETRLDSNRVKWYY